MGSGGLIVMDESTCMVDVARYFLNSRKTSRAANAFPAAWAHATCSTSSTASVPGKGKWRTSMNSNGWRRHIKSSSLCGLGQTAPDPVLTTLSYFRDEYHEHIISGHCRGGRLRSVDPLRNRSGNLYRLHRLREELPRHVHFRLTQGAARYRPATLRKCGQCFDVCRFGASSAVPAARRD